MYYMKKKDYFTLLKSKLNSLSDKQIEEVLNSEDSEFKNISVPEEEYIEEYKVPKIDEIVNMNLLKYGKTLPKKQVNIIPFYERVLLSYELIRKYKIENRSNPSQEIISVIINRLNINRIHVTERKNIIKYALQPFTCRELFEAFPDSSEHLSNDNIELIQSSVDFAVYDSLKSFIYVSKEEMFGPDSVDNSLKTAATKLIKLKEFLDERHIVYNSENIDHWINLSKDREEKISK